MKSYVTKTIGASLLTIGLIASSNNTLSAITAAGLAGEPAGGATTEPVTTIYSLAQIEQGLAVYKTDANHPYCLAEVAPDLTAIIMSVKNAITAQKLFDLLDIAQKNIKNAVKESTIVALKNLFTAAAREINQTFAGGTRLTDDQKNMVRIWISMAMDKKIPTAPAVSGVAPQYNIAQITEGMRWFTSTDEHPLTVIDVAPELAIVLTSYTNWGTADDIYEALRIASTKINGAKKAPTIAALKNLFEAAAGNLSGSFYGGTRFTPDQISDITNWINNAAAKPMPAT